MRYDPLTHDDRAAMLGKIGARDIDALFRDVPKEAVVGRSAFDLPGHQGELEVERALSKLSAKNVSAGAVAPISFTPRSCRLVVGPAPGKCLEGMSGGC